MRQTVNGVKGTQSRVSEQIALATSISRSRHLTSRSRHLRNGWHHLRCAASRHRDYRPWSRSRSSSQPATQQTWPSRSQHPKCHNPNSMQECCAGNRLQSSNPRRSTACLGPAGFFRSGSDALESCSATGRRRLASPVPVVPCVSGEDDDRGHRGLVTRGA